MNAPSYDPVLLTQAAMANRIEPDARGGKAPRTMSPFTSFPPRRSRVSGLFPNSLYRCFTHEEHARQFVEQGIVRVGRLQTYKSIECDSRRDAAEGEGLYRLRGPITSGQFSFDPNIAPLWHVEDGIQKHHTEALQPIFLFCCANVCADMDFLKARFGVHVVLITDPAALAVQMDLALNGEDGRSGPFLVEGRNVEYNKDALITDGRTADKLTDLAWIQKPERFSAEREFRFCLHATGLQSRALVGEADYFKIILGTGKLSHAQLLEVPPKHKMHQMAKDTAVRKATGSRRGHKGKNGPRPD